MPEPLRLSLLLRELRQAGYDCEHLTYRKLWEKAVQNEIPAIQIAGRWHFKAADLSKVAAALQLQHKLRVA